MNTKKRVAYLDTLGGGLILWVIFSHIQSLTGYSFLQTRYIPLLFCFMGWFFFKAGMFFRSKPIKEEMISTYKRLLLPYLFFTTGGILYGLVMESLLGTEPIHRYLLRVLGMLFYNGEVYYTAPAWFLLALSIVRIIFQIAFKKQIIKIVMLLSICLAYVLYKTSIIYPLYLGNISLGLFFFGLGYLLREIQYNKYLIGMAIVVNIFIYCLFPSSVDFRANNVISGTYGGYIMSAVSAIIILNNLFKKIPLLNIRVLTYIGQHSMSFYLLHWPLLLISIRIINHICLLSNRTNAIIAILVCTIGLPLLNKIFHLKSLRKFIGE